VIDLDHTQLAGAVLNGNFTGADLRGVDLDGAKLEGAALHLNNSRAPTLGGHSVRPRAASPQ
jgi:uncharacterized protein YjbI with pentapeptide repeats